MSEFALLLSSTWADVMGNKLVLSPATSEVDVLGGACVSHCHFASCRTP